MMLSRPQFRLSVQLLLTSSLHRLTGLRQFDTTCFMLRTLRILFGFIPSTFRSRRSLLLEVLALRQQLAALTSRHLQPRLAPPDRLFWIILKRLWSGWKDALVMVQPETVIRWHRAGFKLYWTWVSRKRRKRGRWPTPHEVRELIFRMVSENPTWGAPRIHGELRMLGFDISERTVLRWMRKAPEIRSRLDGGQLS